ncbi:hypothetical protein EV284_6466 [Streptomyces sp. BK022]|nr:hypothetical protein EV284_6466 [Streptomyces sp. BK022]
MTEHAAHFNLIDETGQIGSVFFAEADGEDPAGGWYAAVSRSQFPGAEWQSGPHPTAPLAVAAAYPLQAQLREERKKLAHWHRVNRTRLISTPMGGKPRG